MKHVSVPVDNTCQLINITPVNPLISKCQIKVCYVGDGPDRNGSIITKDFAQSKLAPSLPGCPIVGYYNRDTGDFEEHNKIIDISNGNFDIIDTTRPYGFVDLNAKVWFEDYTDDYNNVRTYLVTEGFLWTGAYPESQLIIDYGKGQSMELDPESIQGTWSQIGNNSPEFFIFNEALIEKLCILGDNVEPCFEGANIQGAPTNSFSLSEDFKNTMFAFVGQMKEILDKGGSNNMSEQLPKTGAEFTEIVPPAEVAENAVHTDAEFDILNEKYSTLATSYAELDNKYQDMNKEFTALKEFKNAQELKDKETLINDFSYLTDEDKKNVREHINEYSLKDIKSELSIICVDKKVQFNLNDDLNDDKTKEKVVESDFTLNLNNTGNESNIPAWLKKVEEVQETM